MTDVEGKVEKEEEVIVSMVARRGERGWGGVAPLGWSKRIR